MNTAVPPPCPMEAFLKVITGTWTIHILWILFDQGPQRFGAIRRLVPGISSRVLTERLRMLEHAGVLWREQAMTIPPAVTYGLTERGTELSSVLEMLGTIARRWHADGVLVDSR